MYCDFERLDDGQFRCHKCGFTWRRPSVTRCRWPAVRAPRSAPAGTAAAAPLAFADDAELLRRRALCAACPELAQLVLPDDPAALPRFYCARDLCDDAGRRRCDRRAAGVYAGRLTKQEPTCERWAEGIS